MFVLWPSELFNSAVMEAPIRSQQTLASSSPTLPAASSFTFAKKPLRVYLCRPEIKEQFFVNDISRPRESSRVIQFTHRFLSAPSDHLMCAGPKESMSFVQLDDAGEDHLFIRPNESPGPSYLIGMHLFSPPPPPAGSLIESYPAGGAELARPSDCGPRNKRPPC